MLYNFVYKNIWNTYVLRRLKSYDLKPPDTCVSASKSNFTNTPPPKKKNNKKQKKQKQKNKQFDVKYECFKFGMSFYVFRIKNYIRTQGEDALTVKVLCTCDFVFY